MKPDNCPICYLPRYRVTLRSGTVIRSTYCRKHHKAKLHFGHPLGRRIQRRMWDSPQHQPRRSSHFKDAKRFLVLHPAETKEAVRTMAQIIDPDTVSRRTYPRLVLALEQLRNAHVVTPRRALSVALAVNFLIDASPELLPKTATGDLKWQAIGRALVRLKRYPIHDVRWIETTTPEGTRRSTPRVSHKSPPSLRAMRFLGARLEAGLTQFFTFAKLNAEATLSTPLVESEYLPPVEVDPFVVEDLIP